MKKLLLLILLVWSSMSAMAQETNCGNGIDDDGDGFIDCFDSDCANSVSCKDFYVGRDKNCQVPPTGTASFGMKLGAKSPNRATWTSGRMVVGDLDNDGIPEVVTVHQDDKKLYILDGRDLSVKHTGTITGTAEYFDHAIGNIKRDACAEIFIAEKDGSTYYMSSYNCTGALQWRKPIYGQPITMGLADFDEDGKVELYYRNEILDAETGTRLVAGSGDWTTIDAGSVAVDMLDASASCTKCAGLELVIGGKIYGVDLGARTVDAGSISLAASIPAAASYFPKKTSFGWVTSLTSVADYNQDGSLDVIMSGASGSTGGATAVFLWDVKNNTYKKYLPPNNWQHGTGRLNIADVDGDGKSNATFVSGNKLYALKEDFTKLWEININEGTSGYTGTTVFDFNNDNAVEIVYRDESNLYIINGKTGSIFTSATCRSRTANDYPIVADVDGDGSTEICVTCATSDTDDINDINRAPYGQVRTYKSNLQAWVPARKVWNQHGYFNVNVNDDLTIPRIQQKHHLVFSTGSCTTGANRALNTFLNQSPFLDSKGCPTYASADITYDAGSVQITPPTCPDQAFTVSLRIKNIGDLGLSGTLPITFYQGNPTQAGAVKLNTVNIPLTKFNVGDVVSLTNLSVQGSGSNFTLYVVLNDNGSTVPTPIKLPNSTFSECNYTNNIVSASVAPSPFTIQASLISNNIKCTNNAIADNGAAEVYRLVGGVKVTAGYNFYWFNGAVAGDTATAAFKGAKRTGLAAGTYTIIAYHKGIKCGSTSTQIAIINEAKTINAVITEVKPFTNCKTPDGEMKVTLNGGDPAGNFTYQWFEGNVFGTSPVLSTSASITQLSSVTYSVLVTEKATGCQILESAKVIDKTTRPVVVATATTAKCAPANSGTASANVGGNTSNYTFAWYIGSSVKPAPDFTTAAISSLTAGDYTVVATQKVAGCSSDPVVITVGSNTSVPVATSVVAQQTSCTIPNGSANALVAGSTAGYTFKWFKGNNTLAANLFASTSTVTGLAAGIYTVEATHTANGCVDTEIVTINDVIVVPTIASATVTSHLTQCSPFNGTVTASVSGAGSFTYYWFTGNIGTPDTLAANFKGATWNGRNAGYYTVVAVNKATRCASTRSLVQVLDNTVNPVVTTTSVDQTSCTAGTPNGQASASVGGTTTGYKFRWFAGSDTSVFLTQAATITNRAAATYTVKAINLATKCYTTKQVTISNNLVNPVLTSTIVNNVNCSGVTPTGSVTLQVNNGADPITDFTIQWYEGNGTTVALGTTIGSTAGTNNEKAQSLAAGVYTARVTDNTVPGNGCYIISTFNITNTPAVVTIESADIALTPQSNCSPANGSVTVNGITLNGTGIGNTTGYTFTWYQSNGTTVIPGSGTAATIGTALTAGSYFVKATNTTTNCTSALAAFTIANTTAAPPVTAATTVNNTNCTGTAGNGSITIDVGGVAPVAGQYTIAWFEGNGTTIALGTTVGSVTGAANQTAQGLTAGTYTVRVTDITAPSIGCVTTTSFTIANTPATVTIDNADIAVTAQSDCTPVNGSATVNEMTLNGTGIGNTTGYTFTWYQSNGTTVIPGSGTGATAGTALAAGSYFVKATNTTTNCTSAVAGFTIANTTATPVVAAATTLNNTNCTGATGNGSITINVGGVAPVAGQYTIAWFEGTGTTTALGTTAGSVTGAANQTAQGLPAGTYTVRVTDLVTPNTGCSTTTSFTITNTPAVVTIDNADITIVPQSDCTPVNGNATVDEITLNGTGIGNTTGYTFTWYQSNGTTVIPGSGTTATVGTALAAGSYFVKATSTGSACSSTLAAFTINNTTATPAVTAATTLNNTNCTGATGNGSITINVGGVAPVAGQYTIAWFEGTGTTTALGTTAGSVTGAANQTAQGLPAGTYTVRVTDLVTPNTGCSTTTSFTITNTPAVVTIDNADITIVPQSDCTPVNGNATVDEITLNGTGIGNTTGYTFTWYQSNGTTVIPGSGTTATVGTALAAGSYFVKATSTGSACSSTLAAFTINNTTATPAVTAATTLNNTNCTGATGNGSITINVGGVAPVAGQYTIAWFEGTGTTTALGTTAGSVTGAANQTAQGLPAGTYTVRVTDLVTPNTGCSTTTSFTITNTPAVVTIDNADITIVPQSDCTPVNGNATVDEITLNGTGIGNTTGYTFTWYQSNGTTVIPGSGTTATVGTALAAGSYFVKATSTGSACSSTLAAFTINNTTATPAVTAATTLNNTNCTGATGNGSITINVGGVAPVAGQYTIAWFEGTGTTTALGTTAGSVTGAANQTAQGLPAGTYTVRVTDLVTPNTGCSTTTSFTITNTPAVVTIDNADITIVPQSDCTPVNGNATVDEITLNGTGIGNTTGYTFTWYQSNGTTVIPGSGTTATVGTALAAGSYFVKATSTGSACSSALAAFTINPSHSNPVVTVLTSIDNTNCSGVTANGSITIQLNGGAPATDFIIDWFEGTGTTVPLGTTVGASGGVNKEIAQALKGGTYTVRVRDNATPSGGCVATASFTIVDNFTYPVVTGTPLPNTACDPTKSNGSITADVGGVTAGYTFHIFRGQNILPANEVTNGPAIASNLAAGVYTVQAITNISGCSSTTEVNILNNITLPAIDLANDTNVTSCSTPNGTASVAAVSIGVLSDYTFFWYNGRNIKATADHTGSTITGLQAGEYTVTATNNVLGCDVQVPVTVTVDNDPTTLITISELVAEQISPAICNDGLGQLGVEASSPGNAAGFTFDWFAGDKNIGMTPEGSGQNFPVNSNRISNAASFEPIGSGLHTVIVLDNTSGCRDSLTINLPYSDEAALLSVLTTPQMDCAVPDGGFEASIQPSDGTALNPLNAALDQGWYEIQIYQYGSLIKTVAGVPGTPITDPIVVTGLAAGNYTVLAVETRVPPLPGCSSEPNYVTIGDNRTYPVITANALTDNKNCFGSLTDTGSIVLTVDGTATPAGGYSYSWFDGKLLSSPALPAANVVAPGHSAINIDGGFYTVEVVNAANSCKAHETLYINNTPHVIAIAAADLDVTPQTDCSPANGTATVLDVSIDGMASGGTAGYTFAWFLNDGTTTIPSSSTTASVGTPIDAGSYFVRATNTASNCSSSLIQFNVDDSSVKPVIAANTLVDNSNCSGATPNGSITINLDGAAPLATDFSIQWYTGTGTTTPIAGATTATLANLAAGDYTVEVIDILSPGNTCSNIATFTVGEDLPVYSIAAAAITLTNQTDCVANGDATVTDVLIDGVTNGGTAGFTFEWLDAAGVVVPGSGNTATVGVALAAGDYRVLATNTASQCSSIIALFTIEDVSVKPLIAVNTLTDNSNCSGATPNGSITINVDGAAPLATDFSIQWYTGTGTTTPIAGATTATLANLAAGDYTVEVIDILSPGNTCSNIATFTVGEDLPVYSIAAAAITLTNQTDCVANGDATVTDVLIDGVTNGGTAGFTFEWLDAAGVVVPGSGNTATAGVALAAGDYRVLATNTASQCSSIIALFTIEDVSVKPLIAVNTLTDNSNCSGATPNGSITINVDGAAPLATDFSIQWYTGTGTTTPIAGATTATLANLAAGDYTVEVIDILSPGNTCSNIATFTVGEDLPVYSIAAAAITLTNQTDCVANGDATVTDVLIDGVTNGGTAGFTFEWLDAAGVVVPGSGNTATVGVALTGGDYRVLATNTASQCSSIIALFTIEDVSVKPLIAVNTLTDNSNCSGATPNGSITINVDGTAPLATDFSIQWYTGTGTTTPIAGATTATLANLAAGDYTVEVIDILSPGNTCSNIATFTVGEDLPVYSIAAAAITLTNQTDCVANGDATVTDVLIDGVTNGGTAGFTFEWLDAAGVVVPGSGNTATAGVALAAGDYRVLATNTASQCSSIIALFTIEDVSVKPLIAVNTLTDNSNCSGATPNGSITINVDGTAPLATDFSIQWYTGTGTTTPIAGATTATLANLAAGDYTVEVIDILSPGNTCSNIATFTVGEDLPVYSIAAAAITLTNQTDCVANGDATVTDVLIDGVTNGGTAGFTFEWLDAAGVVVPGSGNTATAGVALAAGDYRVLATNTASQCSSIIALFTIEDVSVKPLIAVNTLTDNSNCSGATPNGSITINVDGAAPLATDFSIQWYTGTGTTTPIAGATTATLANLAAGDYTVEVIDILSPGNTCSNIATFTVGEDLPVYSIAAAAITLTNQTDCVANGDATVTDVLIDGVTNGGTAGFTFEWLDAAGVVVPGSGNTATAGVALAAGDYRVLATNTASQCSSIIALFTIEDVSVKPLIAVNTLTDNSNCSGATPNGSITINVDGAAPLATDFSIQWYTGTGTTTPIAGATTATLPNLAPGDYTVEVIDILSPGSSCSSVATFTIDDTPTVIGIDNSVLMLTDNSDCQPINGSAVVTGILVNGVPVANTTGYTFEWLRNDMTVVDPGNGPTVGINLVADNYFVRATHVASNCISSLTPFTIEDVTTIPVVVAVKNMDNIACNTNYTGVVSASVSEGFTNGITSGYVFEWFTGANNTNPADLINTGSVLSGLAEGDYTVRVIDNTTPSVNCSNVATVTIDRLIPIVNGTLIANAQTVCSPIQDGNMTVNTVQQFLDGAVTSFDMNNATDLSKFAFQWFDVNLVSVSPSTPAYNISPNLETGTFYVQVTDALGCTSDYIAASIEDQTKKPAIAVDEFTNPAICVLPEVRGSIFVSADNNQNFGDYTYEWYEGATTAGTLVEPNSPFLGNIAYTGALTYTVKATNNATQCFTLETYRFATDTVAIQVVASAVPLTSCVADNGSLFAATRTGSGQLYNIEWYIGSGVGGTPDFISNEVLVAPIGSYTAIARHPTLNFCTSIADTVSVTDGRMYPTVVATQKDPSTYCDPANPNGVAEASVNGSIIGYTFDWYEGALSGNSVYTGSEAGVLRATTYVVKATDVISGCPGTTTVTITSDPMTIPLPEISLLSNRTDCGIMDGSLTASVNHVTKDYIFNWYNGSAIKAKVDALGEIYSSLDAGVYTVTATDRISGCTSGPVQKEVVANMTYPEFDINTIATNCNDAIGRAELIALNEGDVQVIEWNIQGSIETGPQISNLPAGTFSVTVITLKNCETTKTFMVKTDITVYNGISRNNDGLNDIFEVGCIGEFPNNSVRIFNRAGTLVYEANGYDNQDIYFNGISNRGISILGNELPDGTYFYIINKNDGTEQRTGYLELLH